MPDKFCPILTTKIKNPIPCQKHACEFFQHVIGRDDQTGAMVDEWACTHIISMRLLVNLAKKTIETTASINKMNNDVVSMSSPEAIKRLVEVKTKKRSIDLNNLEAQSGS